MADLALAEGPILRAILNDTYNIWCEGLSSAAYERYYAAQLATSWGRNPLRRFALVDGSYPLASAKQYTFPGTLDGQPIRIVGLGAVFTHPSQRRRGVARQLLDRLLERATADGADLA